MKNRKLSITLQIIGWITILYNAWLLVSSIITTNESTTTFLDIFVLLFAALLSFPYLYVGIFLVWFGKHLITNVSISIANDDESKKTLTAKAIMTFGWILVLSASIYTLLGLNITNDAEGKAYRLLIISPGIVVIAIGLFIVWRGIRIQKKNNV